MNRERNLLEELLYSSAKLSASGWDQDAVSVCVAAGFNMAAVLECESK